MTTLLERVVGTFYATPQAVERPVERPRPGVVPAVAVLARVDDVWPAGGAVGLAAARRCGAPATVVCAWTRGDAGRGPGDVGPGPLPAPASGAAHRLAQALGRRGHAARASRRLVLVTLPAEEDAAVAEAARVGAACGSAPVVLVLGGARASGFDGALRACDLVFVARREDTDPVLASLAVAGVEALGVPAADLVLPAGAFSRMLAATGVAVAPAARARIHTTLEEAAT